MGRNAWFLVIALGAAAVTGCVERRYVVTTDPPGAVVLRDNHQVGASPADETFVYYGVQHFTLFREGYETMQVDQNIPAPWYEYHGLDFISENLIPWTIRDVRRLHYVLPPLQSPNVLEVGQRAQQLRDRGHNLPPPNP